MLPALRYILLPLVLCTGSLCAQETTTPFKKQEPDTLAADTLPRATKRHPGRAALMSAILPGLGQVYNHKYWKVPIVYAGLGTAVYFINYNRQNYLDLKRAYVRDTNTTDGDVSEYFERGVTLEQIRNGADQYRTWMEYSYLAFFAVYALQIVDATVDAHLFYFDVSDDLSMRFQPTLQYAGTREPIHGLALQLTF